jgi:hypothetical protein
VDGDLVGESSGFWRHGYSDSRVTIAAWSREGAQLVVSGTVASALLLSCDRPAASCDRLSGSAQLTGSVTIRVAL